MDLASLDAGATFGSIDGAIRRTVLPNGVRVLTHSVASRRTCSLSFVIPSGSVDEKPGQYGAAHFLEHLLFKGTKRRTAFGIAAAFDNVGGSANAYTTLDHTCYFAQCRDEDTALAVDVIVDFLSCPLMADADIESERNVIVEELAATEDEPESLLWQQAYATVFNRHPSARPVGGTVADVSQLSAESIRDFYTDHYRPSRLVVTAAGAVDHDEFVKIVGEAFAVGGWDTPADPEDIVRAPSALTPAPGPVVTDVTLRPGEQGHLLLATQSVPFDHDLNPAVALLSTIYGGGMSSRLYQEVREELGLAYDVGSYRSAVTGAEYFAAQAACAPHSAQQVVSLMDLIWAGLADTEIPDSELERAIRQTVGTMVLSSESLVSLQSSLASAECRYGRYIPLEEHMQQVQEVTAADVQAAAALLYSQESFVVAVGPFASEDHFDNLIRQPIG